MMSMSEFDQEFRYTEAKIKMSNPEFFGVTREKAAEYKRILAERAEDLYDPSEPDEEDIIDVEYTEENIPKYMNRTVNGGALALSMIMNAMPLDEDGKPIIPSTLREYFN